MERWSGVGLWRYEPADSKLVDLWMVSFIQKIRWLYNVRWLMGNAIRSGCDLANSVGPFCRKEFPNHCKTNRERNATGRNKKWCRDLWRRDFEVETHLVAGRSGAAKSFPAERTYVGTHHRPAPHGLSDWQSQITELRNLFCNRRFCWQSFHRTCTIKSVNCTAFQHEFCIIGH